MKNVRNHFSLANLKTLLILFCGMTIAAYAEPPSWVRAITTQGSGNGCDTNQCDDMSQAIKIGNDGSLYVTGRFSGTINFGGTTLVSAGGLDIFLAKYGRSGNLLWIVQAGGTGDDGGTDLDLDSAGNIYVTGGFTVSAVFGSTDGKNQTITGGGLGSTTFLAKYTPSGALVWVQTGIATCGGTVNNGFGVAVDRTADTVYITGVTQGANTFSSANTTSNIVGGPCTWHMVLVKYDTSGNFEWGQFNNASPNSIPDGMAVDDKHNVYVTGWLEDGTTFFSNDGKDITVVGLSPAQTTFDYPDDCFLAQYDQDGNAQWVTDIGGYKCNGSRVAASHSGKEVTVVGYFGNINPDNSNFASPSEEETVVTSLPPGKNDTLGDGAFTDPYNQNGFVVTYDTAGVLLRVRRAGGDMREVTTGVAYDSKDNLYVSGVYSGRYLQNLVVRKYSGWTLLWEQRAENAGVWVGNNTILSPALAVDQNGCVFVTGAYQSEAWFGKTELLGTGAADIFLAELASD
ncbi:MAG TPA: hypothetical protein VEH30_07710 [Terriglobales bacterium]|nr:hypothetical protein [Terriglobales bacterium]